jgi:hypothetical protein
MGHTQRHRERGGGLDVDVLLGQWRRGEALKPASARFRLNAAEAARALRPLA